jgi:hypothetical protein
MQREMKRMTAEKQNTRQNRVFVSEARALAKATIG